jgi:hypothetical protein
METKFTEGEYFSSKSDITGITFVKTKLPNGKILTLASCDLSHLREAQQITGDIVFTQEKIHEMEKANAKLFAASKQLLEIVIESEKHYNGLFYQRRLNENGIKFRKKIQNIIQKATE